MKTRIAGLLALAFFCGAASAIAQLYIPIPPTDADARWELLFTNDGPRPAAFRRTVYIPGQVPSVQALAGVAPGRTGVEIQSGSVAGFEVIEILKPGLKVSSRIAALDDNHACRLPVFTQRDILQRRRAAVIQFSPSFDASRESAALVLFSTNGISSKCAVSLWNETGRLGTFTVDVPATSQIAAADLPLTDSPADFARISCSRPFLVFGYRNTRPLVEILTPAISGDLQ